MAGRRAAYLEVARVQRLHFGAVKHASDNHKTVLLVLPALLRGERAVRCGEQRRRRRLGSVEVCCQSFHPVSHLDPSEAPVLLSSCVRREKEGGRRRAGRHGRDDSRAVLCLVVGNYRSSCASSR